MRQSTRGAGSDTLSLVPRMPASATGSNADALFRLVRLVAYTALLCSVIPFWILLILGLTAWR